MDWRRVGSVVTVAMVLVVGALATAAEPQAVVMPNLINLPIEEARAQLEHAGVRVAHEEGVWILDNPAPEAGLVVAQNPGPGALVPKGSGASLWVSNGVWWHTLLPTSVPIPTIPIRSRPSEQRAREVFLQRWIRIAKGDAAVKPDILTYVLLTRTGLFVYLASADAFEVMGRATAHPSAPDVPCGSYITGAQLDMPGGRRLDYRWEQLRTGYRSLGDVLVEALTDPGASGEVWISFHAVAAKGPGKWDAVSVPPTKVVNGLGALTVHELAASVQLCQPVGKWPAGQLLSQLSP